MEAINSTLKVGTTIAVFLCCKKLSKSKIYRTFRKDFEDFKNRVQRPRIKVLLAFVITLLIVIALSYNTDTDDVIFTVTEFGSLSYDRRLKVIKYVCDDIASVYDNLNSRNLFKLFKEERICPETLNYIFILTSRYGEKYTSKIFKLLLNFHLTGSYKIFNGFWYWLYYSLQRLGIQRQNLTDEEILFIYTQFLQRYYKKVSKRLRA